MTWSDVYILRNEILLTLLVLWHLVVDLTESKDNRNLVNGTIVAFALVCVTGFIPLTTTSLFGGMFLTDPLRNLLKGILNLSTLIILLQASTWLRKPENQSKAGAFYMLIFSTLMGMSFMISAGNFLMLYLGLETATLPLTLLAAFDKKLRRSAEAGIKLLMNSAVSSSVLLMGLSLLYGSYGILYFNEMAGVTDTQNLSVFGLILFVAGFGFKLSLVPFHLWTADVYEGAPLPVTMYFSVVSKGAALFTLMLVLYNVFIVYPKAWMLAAYFLSITTMIVGNLFALRQKNLKRFLAFSSITQAGFMMLGFVNSDTLGMATVVYFMLIYALSNLAAFGVLSLVVNATGKESMEDFNGFYQTNPRLSLIMLLALFSLAGIPPVAGFFGKFFLFTAAASQGLYILVLIAVLNATASLYYYLLVVKAMFINKNEAPIAKLSSTWQEKAAFTICLAGIVLIGFTSGIYDYVAGLM